MKNYLGALLLGAALAPLGVVHATDDYADSVISYLKGTGSSGSLIDPSVALGAPTSALMAARRTALSTRPTRRPRLSASATAEN
ncbi:MAG: hypothetical protein WDN28_32860 [Chthoniobacter sp.]